MTSPTSGSSCGAQRMNDITSLRVAAAAADRDPPGAPRLNRVARLRNAGEPFPLHAAVRGPIAVDGCVTLTATFDTRLSNITTVLITRRKARGHVDALTIYGKTHRVSASIGPALTDLPALPAIAAVDDDVDTDTYTGRPSVQNSVKSTVFIALCAA